MSFRADQRQALAAKLDGKMVRERLQDGQTLSYIEGWFAIAEANRIFGFEGWDRETVTMRCVWEGVRHGRHACCYIAQVRIRVKGSWSAGMGMAAATARVSPPPRPMRRR